MQTPEPLPEGVSKMDVTQPEPWFYALVNSETAHLRFARERTDETRSAALEKHVAAVVAIRAAIDEARAAGAAAALAPHTQDSAELHSASHNKEQRNDDSGDRGHNGERSGARQHDGAERQRIGHGRGERRGSGKAGAGHVADAGSGAPDSDGVTPDFRSLSVAMAWDSGYKAGAAAALAQSEAERVFLHDAAYQAGVMEGRAGAVPRLTGVCQSHGVVEVRWIEGAHRCQVCGEATAPAEHTGSDAPHVFSAHPAALAVPTKVSDE